MRIIAGPNGSGKSTLTFILKGMVNLGVYVNADDIKKSIFEQGWIRFSDFGISVTESALRKAMGRTSFNGIEVDEWIFEDNGLFFPKARCVQDYFVAFLADYIRSCLLEQADQFTFETVMSHPSKLEFMRQAKELGFKVYLYFVSLPDPELNKLRVQTRVSQGGHDVGPEKLQERYFRTMNQLLMALKIADSAYVFDNSGSEPKLIAKKEEGTLVTLGNFVPVWYQEYVLNRI